MKKKADYSKTYWNHAGKLEETNAKLYFMVPSEGPVLNPRRNPKLEKFRKASNCYYDLYNNGLGNRAREFRAVFGFGGCGELTQELIDKTDARMTQIIMDAAVEQGIIR